MRRKILIRGVGTLVVDGIDAEVNAAVDSGLVGIVRVKRIVALGNELRIL